MAVRKQTADIRGSGLTTRWNRLLRPAAAANPAKPEPMTTALSSAGLSLRAKHQDVAWRLPRSLRGDAERLLLLTLH